MAATIDVAVCLDCTSSIAADFNTIRQIILLILQAAVTCVQGDVRMALIEYRSHFDSWVTNTHNFTRSIDVFRQWLNDAQPESGCPDGSEAIVDALNESLMLDWRSNDNDRWNDKLVILITDGPPCGLLGNQTTTVGCACGVDLWQLADEFEKQNITLAIVGVEPSVLVCDDFYCALANKTGGEYIPMINAARVLCPIIQSAIFDAYTLSQLFRRVDMTFDIEYNSLYRHSSIEQRVRFMAEHCRTMADIKKWLFTHPPCVTNTISDDDDDEPHSLSSSMLHVNHLLYPSVNALSLTPTPDDEGYRSRLSTTPSADSDVMFIIGSPILRKHFAASNWTTDNDDDCF